MTTSRPVLSWPSVCTDARAQVVEQQRLLGLGQAELPGHAGGDDRDSGEAPVPPSWPAMRTWSALALATPAATVPTPTSATSLTETSPSGCAAQVVDELLEVLDRVDVVVRRRRDQADARRGVADPGDVLVDLVAGQLAALARLGALGHLDLQLVGVDQVVDRHAEAAGGDLLDRRAASRRSRRAGSAAGPRRPRPCSSSRRGGSWRSPATRAPRGRSSPATSRPWRSA